VHGLTLNVFHVREKWNALWRANSCGRYFYELLRELASISRKWTRESAIPTLIVIFPVFAVNEGVVSSFYDLPHGSYINCYETYCRKHGLMNRRQALIDNVDRVITRQVGKCEWSGTTETVFFLRWKIVENYFSTAFSVTNHECIFVS